MTEVKPAPKRDRSPQFPYIGLGKAVERIQKIFEKARRHEVRVADIAADWGLSAKSSSTDRNVAALLAYGLVEENGSGEARKIKVSEAAWRILDDGRPGVKEKLLAEAAMRPAIMADYARKWEGGRPDDTHALSQLKFEGGFTEDGASQFLRVFDETIRFTSESPSDKDTATGETAERQEQAKVQEKFEPPSENPTPPGAQRKVATMQGERELTTGLLSKDANFRLIVSGKVGVREIEMLIKKLELDKEILADPDADDEETRWPKTPGE